MARIYDNIDLKFQQGLQDIITNTGVKRVDFCVGYFNLRGWHLVCDQIDTLSGDFVEEEVFTQPVHRTCRLLIGMHQPDDELLHWLYSGEKYMPDDKFVREQKTLIAKNFRRQLLIGLPTNQDEWTLKEIVLAIEGWKGMCKVVRT